MQSARIVFLNNKSASTAYLLRQRLSAFRLGGLREVAPRFIFFQAHGEQFNRRSPGCTWSYGWQAADFATFQRTIDGNEKRQLARHFEWSAESHNRGLWHTNSPGWRQQLSDILGLRPG